MTHLRKMMLEELERRNYAQTTIDCYLRVVAEFSLLSLATILSGFEISNIGEQAKISSAITLPLCSTCFACGSEQPFASFATDKICFWRTWLFDSSLSS